MISKFNRYIKSCNIKVVIMLIITLINPAICFAYDATFYSSNDILFYNSEDGCDGTVGTSSVSSKDSVPSKYKLPATKGGTGNEDPIDETGHLTTTGEPVTFSALVRSLYSKNSSYAKLATDYAINMRWTYDAWYWDESASTKLVQSSQYTWMSQAPRIVLVTNPKTKRSIYAVVLESGPNPSAGAPASQQSKWNSLNQGYGAGYLTQTPSWYTGRVSGLTLAARQYLGNNKDIQRMSDGSGPDLIYQWASDQSVTPGPTDDMATSTDCSASSTGSDVADEALKLSTKNGTLLQVYKDAVAKYDNGGNGDYTDCGVFVATVMRASGADPNYPTVGTDQQISYVKNSSKYEIIDFHGKDDSILQPGDILIVNNGTDGHTAIWTGDDKKLAQGSLGTHNPKYGGETSWMSSRQGVIIARLKS